MCEAAVRLAKSVGYAGAGTVEFLVEGGTLGPDAPWYFIEMNTRLQVEHPVTEEITGLDLVEWQFRVAAGEKLPKAQADITMSGHAIEIRICAEDPSNGFMPSVGRILHFSHTGGEAARARRVETGVASGGEVSPFYDSMVAKLITMSPDRDTTIRHMHSALENLVVLGVQTNAAFLKALLEHTEFKAGKVTTGMIGRELSALTLIRSNARAAIEGAMLLNRGSRLLVTEPWSRNDAFQLGADRSVPIQLEVDGQLMTVFSSWDKGRQKLSCNGETVEIDHPRWRSTCEAGVAYVLHNHRQTIVSRPVYDIYAHGNGDSTDAIVAPINGRLARIFVEAGQVVAKGDKIAVVEAMKMEHMLVALRDGTIDKIVATEGAQVTQGTLIATLVEEATPAKA
jgi:3-methylcrotonyl-CoA carboxylase alpha subunit